MSKTNMVLPKETNEKIENTELSKEELKKKSRRFGIKIKVA